MARALGTALLALVVGMMLTAAPCVDCVAKVAHGPHRCCGKTKPEPQTDHKCASEAKAIAAEAKSVEAAPLTAAIVDVPFLAAPQDALAQTVAAVPPVEGPPVFLSLESFRC
jgi:hypothetical protein